MNAPLSVPDLLDNASRLENQEFESFFKALLDMYAKKVSPVLSLTEAELLEKIYQKLPKSVDERYTTLTEKRKKNQIGESEYQELLQLVPIIEQYNVERLKNIAELAHLRQTTAQTLMEQLGLMPLYHG